MMEFPLFLEYLIVGSGLGILGQAIRVVLGMKEFFAIEKAFKKVEDQPVFSWNKFLLSLLYSAGVGWMAGLFYMATAHLNEHSFSFDFVLPCLTAGYAGADFFENMFNDNKGKQAQTLSQQADAKIKEATDNHTREIDALVNDIEKLIGDTTKVIPQADLATRIADLRSKYIKPIESNN